MTTSGSATDYNRETYNRIWGQLSDFIRYNPGARHRRRHVFELLEGCRFDSLLDVGCGNGETLRMIDQRWPGRRLAGADLSTAVLEQNRRAMPAMDFFAWDIAKGDAPPATFDVVLCAEVIEHLDDPAAALRQLHAATKPGGHIIVTCPTGRVWPTERHFGHVRHPKTGDLAAWAEAAGLRVDSLSSWGFPTYALTKWAQNVMPDATLREFAGERPYGMPQIAVSTAVWLANYVNLRTSPWGVQLFALLSRPV